MKGRLARIALVLLGFVLGAGADGPPRPEGLADVTDVRVFDHATHTRVVIDVSREAAYAVHELESPPRIYVDVDETWLAQPLRAQSQTRTEGSVRAVRSGQNTLRRTRVVIELDRSRHHRVFHLKNPYRIVADVFRDPPAVASAGPAGGATREAPAAKADGAVGRATAPESDRRAALDFDSRPVQRVVLDPGHGGKDPGALGPKGIREKDIVLRIARAARTRLEREGLEVLLTRDRDTYLTLLDRTDFANRARADLFVSIHANASPNARTSGAETYLLDTRYDRQTARVAARENGTSIAELSELQKILAALRLGYNERFAASLASSVHRSLVGDLGRRYRDTRDLGVKRGPFLVLFQADMPAILVEVGFLTHRVEGPRMGTDAFVQSAASGIAQGILRYREQHGRSVVAGR